MYTLNRTQFHACNKAKAWQLTTTMPDRHRTHPIAKRSEITVGATS
jgi:hypothetical protein